MDSTPTRRRLSLRLILGLSFLFLVGVLVAARLPYCLSLQDAKIRVVDDKGDPVENAFVWMEWRLGGLNIGVDAARSDANGLLSMDSLGDSRMKGLIADAYVYAEVLGQVRKLTLVDGETTLRLPALGAIEVALVDAEGKPYQDPSVTTMSIQLQWTKSFDGEVHSMGHRHQNLGEDGRFRFERVAVGAQLESRNSLQGLR